MPLPPGDEKWIGSSGTLVLGGLGWPSKIEVIKGFQVNILYIYIYIVYRNTYIIYIWICVLIWDRDSILDPGIMLQGRLKTKTIWNRCLCIYVNVYIYIYMCVNFFMLHMFKLHSLHPSHEAFCSLSVLGQPTLTKGPGIWPFFCSVCSFLREKPPNCDGCASKKMVAINLSRNFHWNIAISSLQFHGTMLKG